MKTHFRLALGVVATALSASSATFHVDARAAAGGDGSPARPWRTAHDAVDGVRAARKAGAVKPGARLHLVLLLMDIGCPCLLQEQATSSTGFVFSNEPTLLRLFCPDLI